MSAAVEGGPEAGVVAVTDRMELRRFTPADLPVLLDLDADPQVMHFLNNGAPVDHDVVAGALDAWLEEYEAGPDFGCWAAKARPGGAFLGWFHLRLASGGVPPEPELGYRLRRSVWGRGLATEGSRALIDRCFATTAVPGVRAETMAVHLASRRVMERCGMRLVRTFMADWPCYIPGSEAGDVEYVITREEWVASRACGPGQNSPSRT